MDTINNDLTNLLQQMGVHKESLGITQRIVIIAGILIIAFVADYFCRKIVVPTIKKLTARHYKIFCVNGNTGFRNESRIFYFIHLQNEEAYERKESSSA